MLAVGSLQTQLPLSSRCHLRGTRHSRHGTRPWPTFLATPTPGFGPDARRGRRGLAASEGRGAAPSPLPCALCRRRPRLARASDALSSLCPLSATRLSLRTETHTPRRAGGECGNAQETASRHRRSRKGHSEDSRFPHAPLSSASADAHCPRPEQRPGIAAGAPCSRPGSGCPRQDLGDRNRRPKTPGAATLIAQTRRAAGVSPGDVPGAPGPVTPGRELPTRLRLKPKKLHFATRSPGV